MQRFTILRPLYNAGFAFWLRGVLIAAVGFASPPSLAADVPVKVTAFGTKLSMPAQTPSGTVLGRYYITPMQVCENAACTLTGVQLFPNGGASGTGPVISTNVTGISTRVLVNGNPMNSGSAPNIKTTQPIEVQLLSNGNKVQAGSLKGSFVNPDQLFYFLMSFAERRQLYISLEGDISPIEGTCSVPTQVVPLPPVGLQKFKGVGSTAGDYNFQIRVNNCPAGYNRVGYTLIPVGGAESNHPGALALRSNSTAKGFRIKLTDRAKVPVTFNMSTKLDSYSKSTGGSYSLPLIATYLQTEATPVAGTVNASMQVLMDYQ